MPKAGQSRAAILRSLQAGRQPISGHKQRLLRPWLDLANWAPKLQHGVPAPLELIRQVERERETPGFPRTRLRSLIESAAVGREIVLSESFISLVWKFWKTLYAVAVAAGRRDFRHRTRKQALMREDRSRV